MQVNIMVIKQCETCFWMNKKCSHPKPIIKGMVCLGYDRKTICYSEFSKRKKEITGKV